MPLIIDVGLHRGDDAAFYLSKGFAVLGVEANPAHVKHGLNRFSSEIADGRCRLVHAAIAKGAGAGIEFFINLDKDDWSSTDPAFGTREGSRYETISVPAMTFDALLGTYAAGTTIHYIKSDIEGGDIHVLDGLLRTSTRPK